MFNVALSGSCTRASFARLEYPCAVCPARSPVCRLPMFGSIVRASFAQLERQCTVCLARAPACRLPYLARALHAVCPTWLERCTTFAIQAQPHAVSICALLAVSSQFNSMDGSSSYVRRLLFHNNSIAGTTRLLALFANLFTLLYLYFSILVP